MRRQQLNILTFIWACCMLLLGTELCAQQGALQFVKGGGGGGFLGSNSSNPAPDEIFSSALDKDNNLIVGGRITWTPRFDSIYFGYMSGTKYSGDNGFIAKYSGCGDVEWVSIIWSKQGEWVTGLDVDNEGNIYAIAMVHSGNTTMDSAVIVTPYGNTVFRNCDMIFVKYSPDGHLLHMKTYIGDWNVSTYEAFFPQKGQFKRLRNNTFLTTIYANGFNDVVHIGNFVTPINSNSFLLLDSLGNVLKGATIDTTVGNSTYANLNISNFVLDNEENIYFNVVNYDFDSLKLLDTYFNPAKQYTSYLIKTDTSFRIKSYKTAYFNGVLSRLFIHGDNLYACERVNDGAIFDWDTFHHADPYFGEYRVYGIDTGLNLKWVSHPQYQNGSATWTYLMGAATKDNVYLSFQTRGTVLWDSFQRTTPGNTFDMAMLRLRANDGVCVESKLLEGSITSRDAFSMILPEPQGGALFMGTYAGMIGLVGYDTVVANGNISSPDYFIVKWGLPCSDTTGSLDAPAPPVNLVATATGINSIGINWNDVAQGETGFNLYRSPNGINSWSMVATTAANTPIYNNTGLLPNTTYWYKATSFNQNSESAYSNIDSATTWPATCGTAINTNNTDSLYTFGTTNTGTAPYSYSWSLDGNSSTAATLTAILDTANTYYICVTVTDANNCTATACDTVTVAVPVCAANISTTQTGTYSYSFNASSTGPEPYSYAWSLDGNIQVNTANPFTRTFASVANAYIVCATVTDANGCTATACDTVTVVPATCATNLTYTHTGNSYTFSTTNTGTAPYTYTWANGNSPITANDVATVTLATGTHNICVTVTDANNCTATGCQTITIQPDTCSASVSYTNTGNNYTFSASSTGTAPYTYTWSNNLGANHSVSTLLTAGTQNICVTVTDANGCTAAGCQTITIQPDTCSASVSYINTGNNYTFSASSTGTAPYTYTWSNNLGANQSVTTVLTAGTQNICVTITDANSCTATACQQVIISGIEDGLAAAFSIYPNPVSDVVNVAIDIPQGGSIQLQVTDLQGRIISSETREVIQGSNLLAYNTAAWAAGIYQLHILYGTQHYNVKLVKQ